jgi:hypothetical protein
MLLDLDWDLGHLDLLDNPHIVVGGLQAPAAVRTDLWNVIVRGRSEEFWRGQGAFVLGVPRLTATLARVLSWRWLRLGGLDDVRRRWFRGG